MSRLPVLAVACLTLATACQPTATTPPAATPAATPTPAPVPAPPATTEHAWRGQFVIGKDGYGLTRCGEQSQRIVALGAPAEALVADLAGSGAREFFVEGFGSAPGEAGNRIERIERAYVEGPGCDEATPPFLFKALGTEPFWSVTMAEGQLRLERPDAAPLSGPIAGSPMHGNRRQFHTTSAEGPIELVVERGTCNDGMSDTRYGWTATLRFDGKDWRGCARAGE